MDRLLIAVLYGSLGAMMGGFLNVVIDRLPKGESVAVPGSRCAHCGRRLSIFEILPIVSYLWLRGRCRTCGARIPARMLLVELVTALLFGVMALHWGLTPVLYIRSFYVCALLVIMVIDIEYQLVMNVLIVPAITMALILIPVRRLIGDIPPSQVYFMPSFVPTRWGLSVQQLSSVSQLLGGLLAFLIFLAIWLVSPDGIGDGDLRLAIFVGLLTGFPGALLVVLGSFVAGGVVAILLLLAGKVTRRTTIPFAPFLVVATMLVLFWGDDIVNWYLRF